jgi:hypothetical protein
MGFFDSLLPQVWCVTRASPPVAVAPTVVSAAPGVPTATSRGPGRNGPAVRTRRRVPAIVDFSCQAAHTSDVAQPVERVSGGPRVDDHPAQLGQRLRAAMRPLFQRCHQTG